MIGAGPTCTSPAMSSARIERHIDELALRLPGLMAVSAVAPHMTVLVSRVSSWDLSAPAPN